MKHLVSLLVLCVVATPAFAAGRPTGHQNARAAQTTGAADSARMASVNQINAMGSMASMTMPGNTGSYYPGTGGNNPGGDNPGAYPPPPPGGQHPGGHHPGGQHPSGGDNSGNGNGGNDEPAKDMREKEKLACTSNNIGVGNTFVWASRYSNLSNYASMVEDVEEPANNTCFVKVEVKSNDSRISVADIPSKYFEMGQTITCGSWADEKALEKRILDAKKSARTWGTVAGAVGGAAVGVGAMELFGNKMIGGSVEGQKGLKGSEQLYSQLMVLKKNGDPKYQQIMAQLRELKTQCEDKVWEGQTKPDECNDAVINYNYLLGVESAN